MTLATVQYIMTVILLAGLSILAVRLGKVRKKLEKSDRILLSNQETLMKRGDDLEKFLGVTMKKLGERLKDAESQISGAYPILNQICATVKGMDVPQKDRLRLDMEVLKLRRQLEASRLAMAQIEKRAQEMERQLRRRKQEDIATRMKSRGS